MSAKQDSFKFGFFDNSDNDVCDDAISVSKKQAAEVHVEQHDQLIKNSFTIDRITLCDGCEVKHINCSEVETKISGNQECTLNEAFLQKSDLVPTVYEGGLKIWEGSVDLVQYLCENKIDCANKTVLELGCGAGLPGLYALMNGATVHFQDYNEEVIQHMTIPNAFLNSVDTTRKCKFYSGDWTSLQDLLTSGSLPLTYDVILTAETIYSPDSYRALHSALCALLKHTGVVFLAAKVHYFGVGGGVREFEDLITKEGILQSKVVKSIKDGVNREILEIKFKNTN